MKEIKKMKGIEEMKKLLCLLMALTMMMTIVCVGVSAEMHSSLITSTIEGLGNIVKKTSTINAWMDNGNQAPSRASADYLEVIATSSSLTGMALSSGDGAAFEAGSQLTEDRYAKISFDYKNGKKDGTQNTGDIQLRTRWGTGSSGKNDQWIYCRPNNIYSNKSKKVIGNYKESGYTHFDLVFNLRTGTSYAFIDGNKEPVDIYNISSDYYTAGGLQNIYFYGTSSNAFLLANPKKILYTSDVTLDMIKNDIAGDPVINVTGVSLDKTSDTISIDETTQLNVTVSPSDATYKFIEWTSSNNDVATVDDEGIVTAKSVGEAIITAKTKIGDFSDTCTITVKEKSLPVDVELTALVADESGYTAVVNTVGTPRTTSKLIVAACNNDQLIGIGVADYVAANDREISLNIDGFDVNTTTIKTFVIDLSTMVPYSLTQTYNASNVLEN